MSITLTQGNRKTFPSKRWSKKVGVARYEYQEQELYHDSLLMVEHILSLNVSCKFSAPIKISDAEFKFHKESAVRMLYNQLYAEAIGPLNLLLTKVNANDEEGCKIIIYHMRKLFDGKEPKMDELMETLDKYHMSAQY